jgi:hypothetical protein
MRTELARKIEERLIAASIPMNPGDANLVGDVVAMCACEAERWSHNDNDIVRIADMLDDTSAEIRRIANNL